MSLPQMRHAPSPDGGPIHAAGLRPVRCLLMDDSQFDRRRVMHTAQRAGLRMDVVEAATIAEARDLLTSNDFALCVFDYYLPDGDGIRFAEEVLHNPDRRPVPTIILSGRGTQETPRTALDVGCADYLSKDALNPGRFHRSVVSALSKANLAREARAERAPTEPQAPQPESTLSADIDALAHQCEVISLRLGEIRKQAEGEA